MKDLECDLEDTTRTNMKVMKEKEEKLSMTNERLRELENERRIFLLKENFFKLKANKITE